MILRRLIGKAQDFLINLNQFEREDLDASFFHEFALNSLRDCFAELKDSAGNGPAALERRVRPANEKHTRAGNYYSADGDNRTLGIFPVLHQTRSHAALLLHTDVIYYALCWRLYWEGGCPVVRCPECDAEIDVDEDEVEEGEILTCPECDVELEVLQVHPVHVNVIADEDEDEEEVLAVDDGDELEEDEEESEEEEPEE